MNKYIGERIRIKRELKGFTQEDVAEKLNVATSTYGKLERGETLIDVERLKEITDILETSIGEILDFSIFHNNKKTELHNKSTQLLYNPVNDNNTIDRFLKLSEVLTVMIDKQNKIMQQIIIISENKVKENAA